MLALKTARRLKGWTIRELGRRAGVDPVTISQIERGITPRPSWNVVSRLTQALGVEPEDIFPAPTLPPYPPVETEAVR